MQWCSISAETLVLLFHPGVALIYYSDDVWPRKAQKEAKAEMPPGPHAQKAKLPFI